MMLRSYAFLIATLVLGPTTVSGHAISIAAINTTLPKPLSDMSAALGPDGLIYISGGCDAPDGNVFNNASKQFECGSLSSSFYAFDPATETIATLPDLPVARYRHSCAITSLSQVWIVGGRNLTDSQVLEIDVSFVSDIRCRLFNFVIATTTHLLFYL